MVSQYWFGILAGCGAKSLDEQIEENKKLERVVDS